MKTAGLDPESVVVREIRDDAEAERAGFVGSPTMRIDGRVVAEPGDEPTGLNCRVYRTRDGRISAVPDRADVREALSRGLAPL